MFYFKEGDLRENVVRLGLVKFESFIVLLILVGFNLLFLFVAYDFSWFLSYFIS